MTTERAIETISKLLTRSKEYGVIRMTSEEKKALDKAIEVMEQNKEWVKRPNFYSVGGE